MRWWTIVAVGLFAGCASRSVQTAPSEPAARVARASSATAAPDLEPDPPAVDPDAWSKTRAIVQAAGVESGWSVHDKEAAALAAAGLDEDVALAGLSALAAGCRAAGGWPSCGLDEQGRDERDVVLRWLGVVGSERAIPTLLSLDTRSIWAAGAALEDVLVARMHASPSSCAPPMAQDIAETRATLHDFAIVEPAGGRLVGRPPTPSELDDLAYFLAAVRDAGPPVGTEPGTFRSGATPAAEDIALRVDLLERLAGAREEGNAAAMLDYGTRYLDGLGYPGSIDLDLEADHAWGGARFSYVMRDVALAAEILGEAGISADLYRRANPGGGSCGTSVDYRRGEQVKGLIRAAEVGGRCAAVVAERMLDWDGTKGSPYGPERLVDAGFDLERLYRGAWLTKNRDVEPEALRRAFDRAPASIRLAAHLRLIDRGPEAWEARVFAAEGLADELGARGVEILLAELPHTTGPLRARTIEAIGRAEHRSFMGACPQDSMWISGFGSSVWSRPVASIGTDCATRPSDADADGLHARLAPLLAEGDAVTLATLEALASIAAPRSVPILRKWTTKSSRALAHCRKEPDRDCWEQQTLFDAAEEASRRITEVAARR